MFQNSSPNSNRFLVKLSGRTGLCKSYYRSFWFGLHQTSYFSILDLTNNVLLVYKSWNPWNTWNTWIELSVYNVFCRNVQKNARNCSLRFDAKCNKIFHYKQLLTELPDLCEKWNLKIVISFELTLWLITAYNWVIQGA